MRPAAGDDAVADIAGFEGERLAAVVSIWKRSGRELRARFGGSSMEPAVPAGTEVVLRCGETGAPGDVVAFLAHGRLVLHRVVARGRGGAWTLTRGDARVLPDAPIRDPQAILGRVAGVWRGGLLEQVPALQDSLPRRCVLRLCSALMEASPAVGAAALRSVHSATRVVRSLALFLGRHRVGS